MKMKIDEDLIHEQLENLRDEIALMFQDIKISKEQYGQLSTIKRKLKGIVAICKKEQEERDNDHRIMFDDRIAKFDF